MAASDPAWTGEVDRDALALMLRNEYIPSPYSIHCNVYKLPPGHVVTLKFSDAEPTPCVSPYWSADDFFEAGRAAPFPGDENEAAEHLERLLCDAIRDQMVADVPRGAFLSGGIDSTLVVALMQQLSSRPIESFTIGFHEAEFNEAGWAQHVAENLGTNHTGLYVSPQFWNRQQGLRPVTSQTSRAGRLVRHLAEVGETPVLGRRGKTTGCRCRRGGLR